jgi:glycerophosphoryl diester phosphodiesterase
MPRMNPFTRFTCLLMTFSSLAQGVEIVAHRGYSDLAPENTVAAFKMGWERGTDACELDMHLTADGHIAILHDKDTKRTTGILKIVAQTPWAELAELDAGSWKHAQHAGERIPTLADCLATLPPGNKRFFLEVKCGPEIVPVLAKELEAWKPRAAQLCIIAFDRKVARESKKAMPWMKVYRLSSNETKDKKPVDLAQLIADSKADGLDGLDLGSKWPWSEAMVRQVRDAGLEIYVWTINLPEQAARLAALGVDGITTDDPVMVRNVLNP